MPDEELEGELRRLFAQLIERTPPLQSLSLDAHRRRGGVFLSWRTRTRRIWVAGVTAIAAMAVILAFILPSSSGIVSDSRLGLSISGAAVTAPAVSEVTFTVSYLPDGFHILSTSRENDSESPDNSGQQSTYGRGSVLDSGAGKISVAIEPVLTGTSPSVTFGPGSHSTAGPIIDGVHSVFVARPPTAQIPISGPCTVIERNAPTENIAAEELAWNEQSGNPGVSFVIDVMYEGKAALPQATIVRVAEGVQFDTSTWSCWTDQGGLLHQVTSSAACTSGQAGSPVSSRLLAGGSVIARGSLFGSSWEFVVDSETCPLTQNGSRNSATAFGLLGQNGLSCGPFVDATSEFQQSEANVVIENLPSGQRVACGSVPADVSSVTVLSPAGPGVSEPVLPTQRVGSSFFVMSLGKIGSTCYYVCKGSVTVNLYSGSKLLSSHEVQELAVSESAASYRVRS
jgi:hypothetical protein